MGNIVRRSSRQSPPPWRVREALVDEIAAWWIPVEAESVPSVIRSTKDEVVWSSPFLRWPNAGVALGLAPDGLGTTIDLRYECDDTLHAMDEAALRHRWGQHLDADLREFLDDGYPPDRYHFTPYRVDLEDWSVSARILEEQSWRVGTDLWARVAVDPERSWGLGSECVVPTGSLLRVVGRLHHRMAIRCIALEPPDLLDRLIPDELRLYASGAAELLVPVAEFASHLHLENGH
jgi:hypothetical protein